MLKKRTRFTASEKFIISGSSHIGYIAVSKLTKKIFSVMPVLQSRNCRLYFAGQLISLVGSWMQLVALGWLTLKLTDSAFLVGVVAAMSAIPAMVFALFGGVIVDSFSKKNILLITNFLSMILAFILGILTINGWINITEVIIIALLGGIINSVYAPAHTSYIGELAHKKLILSAITLNSSISSLGRVLGPALAGIYITLAGTGGAFILNGFSYIAVIIALLMIDTHHRVINKHLDTLTAIKDGIVYSIKNPMICSIFIYVAAMSIFGWSYTTIIPVLAKNTFLADASVMGYFFSAIGIGAIAASIMVSILLKRYGKLLIVVLGNILFAVSIFLFSFTSSIPFGEFYLFLSGVGLVSINIVLFTMVQLMTHENFRGRISSIYFLLYGGLIFLGNLEIGYLAEKFGAQFALRLNTTVVLLISIIIYFTRSRLRQAQKSYLSR